MKIRTGKNKPAPRKTTGKRSSRAASAGPDPTRDLKAGSASRPIGSAGWQRLHPVQKQNLAASLGGALGNRQAQRALAQRLIQRAPASLHDRLIAVAEKTKRVQAIVKVILQASDQEIEKLDYSLELRGVLVDTVGIPGLMKVSGAIVDRQDQIEAAKRKKFLDAIEDADRYILLANLKAKAWLGSIGNAYYNAWDRHKKTLEAQRADNSKSSIGELIGSLILDAALTFVTGGVGGLVAKKMKGIIGKDPNNYGAFMLDGIKDLSKFGVKTAGGGAIGALKGDKAGAVKPYPIDPFLWKGREEVRINTELALVTQEMINWTKKVRAKDPDFDYKFDPTQVVEFVLTVNGIPVKSLQPVDEEQEANNFEKGFWAAWLERNAYSANLYGATSIEDPLLQIPIKKTPISVIVKRCKELELDVDPYLKASKDRAQQTVRDAKRMRSGKGMEA